MKNIILLFVFVNVSLVYAQDSYVFESGHESLKKWTLPLEAPFPENNKPT